MTEDFLQFIWKNGLFDHHAMITDEQDKIEVLNPGEFNPDSGPDFLNARIRIGNTLWAGNVEVHVRSSDWFRHSHQHDKAFDSVILQVVHEHDRPVRRTGGEPVPTALLRFESSLFDQYSMLMHSGRPVPCLDRIADTGSAGFECWLRYLVAERMQQKVENISQLLSPDGFDWENAFYVVLARSLGSGLNSQPFEMLARSLPLKILGLHRGDRTGLEALLFGQSGLLEQTGEAGDDDEGDAYMASLRKVYVSLKDNYGLVPLQKHLWKFLRVRPVNFPTIRISQLAALMDRPFQLFSNVVSCPNPEDLFQMFDIQASEYWETHYTFDKTTVRCTKKLGKESMRMLMINAVIPFIFVYGSLTGDEALKDRAVAWLQSIPPERNRAVKRWTMSGFVASTAFHTQGLLQLTSQYCNRKRCLACQVGTSIIRTGVS